MADGKEILKDKRVVIGGAVGALLVAAGVGFALTQGGGGGGDEQAAAPASPPGESAPAAPPTTPIAPANPGTPGTPTAQKAPGTALASAPKAVSSFADAPPGYGGGGAGAVGQTPAPPSGGAGGAALDVPAPIQRGVKAASFRPDPFVSYRFLKIEQPAAYTLAIPLRLASPAVAPEPPPNPDPVIRYGALPPVDRRVAGILYDGVVSAILETGTPGAGAAISIIQPGSRVPSGIPGLDDLTVSAITRTDVTLRDEYGRTVSVPLSAVPSAYLSGFQQAVGGNPAAGASGDPGAPPSGAPGGRTGGGGIAPPGGGF